jgi:hypothetical protein
MANNATSRVQNRKTPARNNEANSVSNVRRLKLERASAAYARYMIEGTQRAWNAFVRAYRLLA